MKARVAIVDDEIKLLRALKRALELDGYHVFDFSDPRQGLDFILKQEVDLVISDIRMGGLSGIELLGRIKQSKPELPCILMTAFSSVETAVTAVKLGARDYLLKPFELADFKTAVSKALSRKKILTGNYHGMQPIIGNSAAMRKIENIIEKISDTSSTVLVYGESGTGKELIARAIHQNSQRQNKPFIAVNCSAIPEQLFESEMFGHKKGSFTNAYNDKPGLFKDAEGGSLFLDEIGDLPITNQAKLLRVLQDGGFKPVGSNQQLQADVRVIAATNKQLHKEVEDGNFREDLLYRLTIVEIELPPLRQRRSDIKELADYFINLYADRHGRQIDGANEAFYATLIEYDWPGNIRQLENCVERAVILKRSGELTPEDLNLPQPSQAFSSITGAEQELDNGTTLNTTIDRIEENIILQALDATGWNFSKAAGTLGVTRQNLHYKLKKYGIKKEE